MSFFGSIGKLFVSRRCFCALPFLVLHEYVKYLPTCLFYWLCTITLSKWSGCSVCFSIKVFSYKISMNRSKLITRLISSHFPPIVIINTRLKRVTIRDRYIFRYIDLNRSITTQHKLHKFTNLKFINYLNRL